MSHVVERLDENKIKVTVTVPADEVQEACKTAAAHLSDEAKIPGFRPGKAPYDVVKQRLGEMAILEHAAEDLVRQTFVEAMIAEDLETVGQPFFAFVKLAPGNDFVYTAEMSLMPTVTKLADYHALTVDKHDTEPTQALFDDAKNDLTRMRTKEVRAEKGRTLAMGDKAVVTLTMQKDGVVIEGGEAQNHGIYTKESYYIPGFIDEILGLAEDEEKTFALQFPSEHYQKHIAGKNVDFTVKMQEIFLLETPAFDDAFATTVGMKSAAELEERLRENLRAENVHEEMRRQDKAVLDLLADKSTFEAIPDLLANQEIEKMIHELRHQVETQGLNFDEYLTSVGKSLAQLKLDFAAPALQRVKVAIIIKEIAKRENVTVDAAELDAELDKIAAQFAETDESHKRVYEPQYREYVERQLTNRKTIDLLKSKMVR